jgi:hypothetical protein
MLPVLAMKAASIAVAAWIGLSGAQVATYQASKASISKSVIRSGITAIVRKEEIAKHQIKAPAGYSTYSEGIKVAWNPKTAQSIAKKLNKQGWLTQVKTDPSDEKLRNVFKKAAPKPPKTTKDKLATMFGNWVYWLDSYDYKRQAWVPNDDPAIQQQEQEDRDWWKGLSPTEKRKYAEFVTKRGHTVDQTLKDLERMYK